MKTVPGTGGNGAQNSAGVRICICGTRGSYPAVGTEYTAYGGHTACMAVLLPSSVLVLDGGTGLLNLPQHLADRPITQPIRIFLTHLHYDHILGLPLCPLVYQAERDISVYAADNLVQSLQAFWCQPYFPVAVQQTPAKVRLIGLTAHATCDLGDGYMLEALRVHSPAHGEGVTIYRLRGPECDMAYVTDVELAQGDLAASVLEFVRSTDLLLCDSQYLPGNDYEQHRGWGHNSVEMACKLARWAQVKALWLVHHEPSRSDTALGRLAAELTGMEPPIGLAAEGMVLTPGLTSVH